MTTRGRARIGCSGFNYRDWRGIVYPPELPSSRWLPYYATRFDTVELNNTFYRLPTKSAVQGWAAAVPDDFVFAVKLGQFGSHRRKLRLPETWLPNHLDRIEALGSHLGPTLVQLPPRWRRDVERLDAFLAAAPRRLRWAVELRDRSWLHDDVYAVLERHGAALCLHDLLTDHPILFTADWTYIRFHGPDALHRAYHGAYGGRRLWRWARRIDDWLAAGCDVYAYFNNDVGAAGVGDAAWLRDRVEN